MTEADRSAQHEAMSRVDTAWLRMETPTNLMMITGVLMLRGRPSLTQVRRTISQRFLAWRRFRQRPVDVQGAAYWQDDPAFDIAHHVVRLRSKPRDRYALQALVSQLAATPLERAHPLWQFQLVDYGDGAALICRIHHCYADGVALVQVMLSMTDLDRAGQHPCRAARPDTAKPPNGHWLPAPFEHALQLGEQMLGKGAEWLQHPDTLAGALKDGGAVAAEIAHLLAMADDTDTLLKGPLGADKRCAWAPPLALDDVKAVGRGVDCTVNDVLLAAATGALREHLLDRGAVLDGVRIRASVPVNLRDDTPQLRLGNQFGLVFLDLPIGEPNPIRRLQLIAERMQALKHSKQAIAAYGVLAALGSLMPSLQHVALDMLSRKASLVATNVPGPTAPLYLAGAEIDSMMFWVPQTGAIGLGISLISYNGQVYFGLIADPRRIPDPNDVADRFRSEFDKLLYAILMEDWQQPVSADHCEAELAHYGNDRSQSVHASRDRRGACRPPRRRHSDWLGAGARRPDHRSRPQPSRAARQHRAAR